MNAGDWTALEVVKLAIALLTPALVACFGYWVSRTVKRLEDVQWASRKLIERRLELYDGMAPDLNRLYCFFATIGDFRRLTPPEALETKRRLDAAFHVYRFLMGEGFATAYFRFVDACFKHYVGAGQDALLRADPARQRTERGDAGWSDEWAACFVKERGEMTEVPELRRRYEHLMTTFADEVGVRARTEPGNLGERRVRAGDPA